jgi:hypothetical protein
MRPLLILKMRVLMQMYRCKAKAQHAAPGASATLSRRHDHSSSALPHSQQRPNTSMDVQRTSVFKRKDGSHEPIFSSFYWVPPCMERLRKFWSFWTGWDP